MTTGFPAAPLAVLWREGLHWMPQLRPLRIRSAALADAAQLLHAKGRQPFVEELA